MCGREVSVQNVNVVFYPKGSCEIGDHFRSFVWYGKLENIFIIYVKLCMQLKKKLEIKPLWMSVLQVEFL